MNQRKLHLELMRAILRSSTLQYDEAYPVVASIVNHLSTAVQRKEQEVEAEKKKKLEEAQKKIEETRKRYESQTIG